MSSVPINRRASHEQPIESIQRENAWRLDEHMTTRLRAGEGDRAVLDVIARRCRDILRHDELRTACSDELLEEARLHGLQLDLAVVSEAEDELAGEANEQERPFE